MASGDLHHEVIQDLKRAGLLDFASDAGFLDVLHSSAPSASSDGSLEAAREASLINAQASVLAAAAEVELRISRKRLHDVVSRPPVDGSNSVNSSMGRKSAQVDLPGRGGQANNKGLRHFAMSVCHKIESKRRTTYNEVADELVEELRDPSEPAGDDKNIRRRVYDAFNVLLAVGIITKEGKKEIIWTGFSNGRSGEEGLETAQAERLRIADALERKQQQMKELIEQHDMVKQLLEVNPIRNADDADIALQIPFVLVRAKPEATVEVSVSESMQEVDFKFNAPFSLHDDTYVLKQTIQHFGSIRQMHEQQQQAVAECAASS